MKVKERDLPFQCPNCGRPTDAPGRPCGSVCRDQMLSAQAIYIPGGRVETMEFYACMNARCRVRNFPVSVGSQCPVCEMSGVYAGVVAKIPDPPQQPEGSDDEAN